MRKIVGTRSRLSNTFKDQGCRFGAMTPTSSSSSFSRQSCLGLLSSTAVSEYCGSYLGNDFCTCHLMRLLMYMP